MMCIIIIQAGVAAAMGGSRYANEDYPDNFGHHNTFLLIFLLAHIAATNNNNHAPMIVIPPTGVTFTKLGMSNNTDK
jgi:hypothetical protein